MVTPPRVLESVVDRRPLGAKRYVAHGPAPSATARRHLRPTPGCERRRRQAGGATRNPKCCHVRLPSAATSTGRELDHDGAAEWDARDRFVERHVHEGDRRAEGERPDPLMGREATHVRASDYNNIRHQQESPRTRRRGSIRPKGRLHEGPPTTE